MAETVVQDHLLTEEEIALATDLETDTEERRESKTILVTQEAGTEITGREELPAEIDPLVILNDDQLIDYFQST